MEVAVRLVVCFGFSAAIGNSMTIKLFKDIANGKCFRLVEPEPVCSRMVYDSGVFVKIGNSHAVRFDAAMPGNKTIIPGLKTKCQELPGKVDTSELEDWSIVNRPFTNGLSQ